MSGAKHTAALLGCHYEAPTFGARYPDGTCIDGFMWDLDSGDYESGLSSGGDMPCPWCNSAAYVEWLDSRFSGNARQRRLARRFMERKVRVWAEARSSFPPDARAAIAKATGSTT